MPWQQAEISLFGRKRADSALELLDGRCRGGVPLFEHHVYAGTLAGLRSRRLSDQLEAAAGTPFNSVLLNYYRNGQDAMGWHSDDEPELGPQPVIASISLGAYGGSCCAHKGGGPSSAIELAHGSLLLMQGDTQKNYRHSLPRTAKPVDARINLTFRKIL